MDYYTDEPQDASRVFHERDKNLKRQFPQHLEERHVEGKNAAPKENIEQPSSHTTWPTTPKNPWDDAIWTWRTSSRT